MCNNEEAENVIQGNEKLSFPSKKLKEITVTPKIKDGKMMLEKNNSKHRYLYDD